MVVFIFKPLPIITTVAITPKFINGMFDGVSHLRMKQEI